MAWALWSASVNATGALIQCCTCFLPPCAIWLYLTWMSYIGFLLGLVPTYSRDCPAALTQAQPLAGSEPEERQTINWRLYGASGAAKLATIRAAPPRHLRPIETRGRSSGSIRTPLHHASRVHSSTSPASLPQRAWRHPSIRYSPRSQARPLWSRSRLVR